MVHKFYLIWCDSEISRVNGKVQYFVFKSKYKALRFFHTFKKMKAHLGIAPNFQFLDDYMTIAKYRTPLQDGFLIYEADISTIEKELIQYGICNYGPYTTNEIKKILKGECTPEEKEKILNKNMPKYITQETI